MAFTNTQSMSQPEPSSVDQLQDPTDTPVYEDGFSTRTIIGAVFVGLVMMPGSIYLSLVAGQSLGPAAEWVTIIFFVEIARRSLTTLKRQEVFIIYYVAMGLGSAGYMAMAASGGSIFAELIRNQYLVQFPQAIQMGIADQVPGWAAPSRTSPGIETRSLLHAAWLAPIGLIVLRHILGRLGCRCRRRSPRNAYAQDGINVVCRHG